MAELLTSSIQVSGLSEEELETKLGWSPGTMGRLLEGDELDPEQVLEVLAELNGDSSWELGPDTEWDERTQVSTELMDRFRRLGYETTTAVPKEQQLSILELEKRVEVVLWETFGEEIGEGGDEEETPEDA